MAELSGAVELRQLAADLGHWRAAAAAVADLDAMASPAAWAALERYLGTQVRQRLGGIAASLGSEADRLAAQVAGAAAADTPRLRARLLDFRRRYLQAETVINFYAQAVNHRTTPRLAGLLRGLDALATDLMQVLLRPMGHAAPPVLSYLDVGLGASILRYGVRLWDSGALSPAAAMKVSFHQLQLPTSSAHECGHQVAHMLNWNAELADALWQALQPYSPLAAAAWRDWASEVAADVHAFALLGYGPVPPLASVVDGATEQVFTTPPGDPHPFAWLRVLFNIELCRSWFGGGPWDDLRAGWLARHPLELAPPGADHIATVSLQHLPRLVDVCTRQPMRAFGGRALYHLADPSRANPVELGALARRAGPSLYTSTYLQRQESVRIVAWNAWQAAAAPESAPEVSRQLADWLMRLGGEPLAAAA